MPGHVIVSHPAHRPLGRRRQRFPVPGRGPPSGPGQVYAGQQL